MDVNNVYSEQVAKQLGFNPTLVEHVYLIPDGKNLALEVFQGGHEYSTKQIRIELWVRTTSGGDTLINCGYGQDFHKRVEQDFEGDGDRKIVVKMINGDPGQLHMTASWFGRLSG